MPELPEVETIRRQLSKKLNGQKIVNVSTDTPKMVRPSVGVFSASVVGKKVVDVRRFAKYIVIGLSGGDYIVFHLKLNGRLFWRSHIDQTDPYTHVFIEFNDGNEMRLADSRKFAYVEYASSSGALDLITVRLGPEPLNGLTAEHLYSITQSTKRAIKTVLLDQSKVGGVGNIYANDALWVSRIHPATPANKISRAMAEKLLSALGDVIGESLSLGGASEQWFRHINGDIGHYQDAFKVYARKGLPCLRHPSDNIEYGKLGQRGTFWCPKCQIRI